MVQQLDALVALAFKHGKGSNGLNALSRFFEGIPLNEKLSAEKQRAVVNFSPDEERALGTRMQPGDYEKNVLFLS